MRFYIVLILAAVIGYNGFVAVDGAKQTMGSYRYAQAQAIEAAGK